MASLNFREVMAQMDKAIDEMANAVDELRDLSLELKTIRDDAVEEQSRGGREWITNPGLSS